MKKVYSILFFLLFHTTSVIAQIKYSDSLNMMFGYACGIGGSPLPYMLRTVKLVNNSEKEKLYAMLVSENPQDQIYGYVGLYFYKSNGNKLSKNETQQMKTVQQSEQIVTYCRGCFFGLEAPLKDLLRKKRLKSYYRWYVFTGYNKY